jgi:hypothetical protein
VHVRNKLAVAMTAISITAVAAGIGSGAAQAQDEVLQATATTFSAGGVLSCFKGSASATFSASGPAAGPYDGTFTETAAKVSVSTVLVSAPTPHPSSTLTLSIPFTISSGSTTITGTITNPPPYSGGSIFCYGGGFYAAGPDVNANAATYTATIQSQRQLAQTVTGTAQVMAGFRGRPLSQPQVLVIPPKVTLLDFPSP